MATTPLHLDALFTRARLGLAGLSVGRLIALWVFSIVIHVAVVEGFLDYPIALDDMYQYDMLGRSLATGQGYRWYAAADWQNLQPYFSSFMDVSTLHPPAAGLITTFRGPGYPAFLALIYMFVLPANRFVMARLAQTVLIGSLAPITAWLAFQMGASRRDAMIAGTAMALYPILLLYPIGLASENLFIPLVGAAMIALLRSTRTRSLWPPALAGGLLGIAVLTRSIIAVFVVLAAWWMLRHSLTRVRGALVMVGMVSGLCMPWAVRNSLVLGRPTFVETSLGYNLFVANHPDGDGGFVSKVAILPLKYLDDGVRDRFCTSEAMRFVAADPLEALRRTMQRLTFFVGLEDREVTYFYSNGYLGAIAQPWLTILYLALVMPWMATLALSGIGWSSLENRATRSILALLVIGYTVPHLFVIAEPRFHLALVPVLVPLAIVGLRSVQRAIRQCGRSLLGRTSYEAFIGAALAMTLPMWKVIAHWDTLMQLLGPNGHLLRLPY